MIHFSIASSSSLSAAVGTGISVGLAEEFHKFLLRLVLLLLLSAFPAIVSLTKPALFQVVAIALCGKFSMITATVAPLRSIISIMFVSLNFFLLRRCPPHLAVSLAVVLAVCCCQAW